MSQLMPSGGVRSRRIAPLSIWTAEEFEPFHHRDRNGTDMSLILESGNGRVVAAEVKVSTSLRGFQFTGLRNLRDRLSDPLIAGSLLNDGSTEYRAAARRFHLAGSSVEEVTPNG